MLTYIYKIMQYFMDLEMTFIMAIDCFPSNIDLWILVKTTQ